MALYDWSTTTFHDGTVLEIRVELPVGPRILTGGLHGADYLSFSLPPPATGQNPDSDGFNTIGNPLDIDHVDATVTGPGTVQVEIFLPNGNVWRTITQTAADGLVEYQSGGQMRDTDDLARSQIKLV